MFPMIAGALSSVFLLGFMLWYSVGVWRCMDEYFRDSFKKHLQDQLQQNPPMKLDVVLTDVRQDVPKEYKTYIENFIPEKKPNAWKQNLRTGTEHLYSSTINKIRTDMCEKDISHNTIDSKNFVKNVDKGSDIQNQYFTDGEYCTAVPNENEKTDCDQV